MYNFYEMKEKESENKIIHITGEDHPLLPAWIAAAKSIPDTARSNHVLEPALRFFSSSKRFFAVANAVIAALLLPPIRERM